MVQHEVIGYRFIKTCNSLIIHVFQFPIVRRTQCAAVAVQDHTKGAIFDGSPETAGQTDYA